MLVNVKCVGILTYIRCFLENLIWFFPLKLNFSHDVDKCRICGKPLLKRRFELSIDRPNLGYSCEYDNFLCLEHAIQTLMRYKGVD